MISVRIYRHIDVCQTRVGTGMWSFKLHIIYSIKWNFVRVSIISLSTYKEKQGLIFRKRAVDSEWRKCCCRHLTPYHLWRHKSVGIHLVWNKWKQAIKKSNNLFFALVQIYNNRNIQQIYVRVRVRDMHILFTMTRNVYKPEVGIMCVNKVIIIL